MLKIKLLVVIVLTYLLIVFGGYVASSESGMGCGPEWPLCNGAVIPELQGDTLIEFAHRVIGLVLFLLFSQIVLHIYKKKRYHHLKTITLNSYLLLLFQILAGAVVVILDLPALVVTLHLVLAMIFSGLLIYLYHHTNGTFLKGKKTIHLPILLLALLSTIGLGAYVKHTSIGLACSWLDCHGTFMPNSLVEWIQTIHRVFALISFVYLIFVAFIYRNRSILIAILLFVIQMAAGIITILTQIDMLWGVLHLALATAVYYFVLDAWLQPNKENSKRSCS
ncbi:COX15/CtaA family protein [Gracilibacillus suaedae]|uniref:COX15/CtaA family protein n=1 Tax=Gracilibacillus suaedae TaxID=2820273 RepID=UPI001ABE0E62|nr:COX15/CtaA family protein [Gracilibacillus suaedae]